MIKTQSKKLSENVNQHAQKNLESQKQDVEILKVILDVKKSLEQKYSLSIDFNSKIYCSDIEKIVSDNIESREDTYIKPDGGFLSIKLNDKDCFILVSEQKRQGTNDARLSEGKSAQAKGNAVERLGKNVDAFDVIFSDEDIYPFVVFLQGCDFYKEESTIVDRVRTIAKFQPFNTINLYWKQINKRLFAGGSFFMRGHSMHELLKAKIEGRDPILSDWKYDEMYSVMYQIADESIQYYLDKYNKKNPD
jgi:type II restriction enzyme